MPATEDDDDTDTDDPRHRTVQAEEGSQEQGPRQELSQGPEEERPQEQHGPAQANGSVDVPAGGPRETTEETAGAQPQEETTEGRQALNRGARGAPPRQPGARGLPAGQARPQPKPASTGPQAAAQPVFAPAGSETPAPTPDLRQIGSQRSSSDNPTGEPSATSAGPRPGSPGPRHRPNQPARPRPITAVPGPHGPPQPDFRPAGTETPPPPQNHRQIGSQREGPGPATTPRPVYALPDIVRLLDHGAHLVLCAPVGATRDRPDNDGQDGGQPKQDKRPLWKRWQLRRPTLQQLNTHAQSGGLIGVIPASLNCAALDVDQGDPVPLLASHPPRFVARSLSPGRLHAWYPAPCSNRTNGYGCPDPDCPARPGDFRFQTVTGAGTQNCNGQVVGHNAYVVLWHDAMASLADTLDYEQRFSPPTPRPIGAVPLLRTNSAPRQTGPEAQDVYDNPDRPAHLSLHHVSPGHRNNAAFNHVRHQAYALRRHYRQPNSYTAFLQAVTRLARNARSSIRDRSGFPPAEADAIARSIAQWSWTHIRPTPSPYDHTPHRQRQRRYAQLQDLQHRVSERQAQAARYRVLGLSQQAVGHYTGVSPRTVRRDLAAVAANGPLPSRRNARRTLQAQAQSRQRAARAAPNPNTGTAVSAPPRVRVSLPRRHDAFPNPTPVRQSARRPYFPSPQTSGRPDQHPPLIIRLAPVASPANRPRHRLPQPRPP